MLCAKECFTLKELPCKGCSMQGNAVQRELLPVKYPMKRASCTKRHHVQRTPHTILLSPAPGPTWVHSVACHLGSLQPRGQLTGVQHIGQFAVTVVLEGGPQPRRWVAQSIEAQAAGAVGAGGDYDDATGSAALQPLQQQLSEQEMAQVVHLEGEAEAVLCCAPDAHPCKGGSGTPW